MAGRNGGNQQVAVCLLLLLFGREVQAVRAIRQDAGDLSDGSEVKNSHDTDVVRSAVSSHISSTSNSASIAAGDEKLGEAVRGKLKYFKHDYSWDDCSFFQVVAGGCWVSRITVVERGEREGEVVLKIYKNKGTAKKLFDSLSPMQTDDKFKGKYLQHEVHVPKDAWVAYNADGKLEVRVDTNTAENGNWRRTVVHKLGQSNKVLNLWVDPDDMQVQFRQERDPNGLLMTKTPSDKEQAMNIWTTAIRNLQVLDTCVATGSCFTQCTYIEEMGGCTPAHFCRPIVATETSFGRCESLSEDEELAQAWRNTVAEIKGKISGLEQCLMTCKGDWENTQKEAQSLSGLHETLMEQEAAHGAEKPKFYEALKEETMQAVMASLVQTFLKHKEESYGLGAALKYKNCDLDGGFLNALLANANGDEETARNLEGLMEDCPMLTIEMQKTPAQRETEANSNFEEMSEYEGQNGVVDESALVLSGRPAGSLLQRASDAVIEASSCEVACIVFAVFASLLVTGILIMFVGRLLCWAGTALMGVIRGKNTKEKRALVHTQYLQCATVMNRVGYVLFVAGLVGIIVTWIVLCIAGLIVMLFGGNLLQVSETVVSNATKQIAGPSNATSMAETAAGTGFCGLSGFNPVGMGGMNSYWFWWSFSDVNIVPSYSNPEERELRRRNGDAVN